MFFAGEVGTKAVDGINLKYEFSGSQPLVHFDINSLFVLYSLYTVPLQEMSTSSR